MISLVYVSIATKPFTAAELLDLLDHARRNNLNSAITGMLLYKEGNFMQVLEGDEKAVKAVSAKIARDPRHHKMITLLEVQIPEREFPDWSMGFNDLDAPLSDEIPGYSEFMNTPLTADAFSENPTRAQRLLRVFKRT